MNNNGWPASNECMSRFLDEFLSSPDSVPSGHTALFGDGSFR